LAVDGFPLCYGEEMPLDIKMAKDGGNAEELAGNIQFQNKSRPKECAEINLAIEVMPMPNGKKMRIPLDTPKGG
jgi:hypothetical protein